ncbi:MAG: DinB family protein [Flavitalea sp.]
MHALILAYDLHTRLFENVIDGLTEKDAQNRLNTRANHIAWIAGSIVHERFELANALNIPIMQTSGDLFENQKGIQDKMNYPSLKEYKHDWKHITPVLREALVNITTSELESRDQYQMPGENLTFFEAMAFIIDRESYCIGQIGLYRRLLGYEPMKYE